MKSFTKWLEETGALPPSVEEERIADDAVYLSNMSKSFADKAWFVRYVPKDISRIVDFGGGSGEFCEYVRAVLARRGLEPEFAVVDNNPSFLEKAVSKGFAGYASLEEYSASAEPLTGRTMLVMSSVIHEVYSYADPFYDDVGTFWTSLGRCGFDMIAIRDMSVNDSDYVGVPFDAVCWVYENVFRFGGLTVKGRPLSELLCEFEDRWGKLCDLPRKGVDVKNLMHFLVKYRYVENWKREVDENYFPVSQDRLERILRGLGYRLTHKESSRLDFYRRQWTKDFRLNRPDDNGYRREFAEWLATLNTHIKWLAER